tara:strand:+ start:12189 stop:12767 length:579 start_codon:yes stop_codon:yes gene_type:complete
VYPALHKQDKLPVLASGEFAFASQLVQDPEPVEVLNFPWPQAEQLPPSGPVYPALHVQDELLGLASGEFAFAAQFWHVSEKSAARAVEYLPATQLTHSALPSDILYLPASQAEQLPPSGPVYPLLHKQDELLGLATGEFAFASQLEQSPEPVTSLYFPCPHGEQLPPSGPVYPVLHLQSEILVAATTETEFA